MFRKILPVLAFVRQFGYTSVNHVFPSEAGKMSVLEVFGQNLRSLTAMRGSQAAVAQDLGVNRIQFQRYLRAESFPKPNVLKRICDYFGVDARIMTDPLTNDQLGLVEAGQYLNDGVLPKNIAAMCEGVSYAVPDQDYFEGTKEFTDGLYEVWRGSNSYPDCAIHFLLRLKTLNSARVLRGYDPRAGLPHHLRGNGPYREFRGLLLRPREGYTMLFFSTSPIRSITLIHVRTVEIGIYSVAASGIQVVARSAHENVNRITRCLITKIDGGWPAIMQAARIQPFVKWEDVPENIYTQIRPRDETF